MELQRILAKDSRAAMDQVNKLYGQDALVISNKRTRNKTELIVAVDLKKGAENALNEVQIRTSERSTNNHDSGESFDDIMESKIFNTLGTQGESVHNNTRRMNSEPSIDQEKETKNAQEIVSIVKSELAVMRRELLLSQQLATWPGVEVISNQIQPLIKALNETGISLSLKTLITSLINDLSSIEEATKKITEAISNNMPTLNLLDQMSGVHLFAGTPGAGKTTMIGKIALQKSLEIGEEKIAVVSFNDTRVGAWNQIQLLCGQAGVDTYKASSIETLEVILQELSYKKLVLIDTDGSDPMSLLNLKTNKHNISKHLVISAESSEGSISRYIETKNKPWDSVLISKYSHEMDYWPIINALVNRDIPISIISKSSNLQDPVSQIDSEKLVSDNLKNMQFSLV